MTVEETPWMQCSACGSKAKSQSYLPVDETWFCRSCERAYPFTLLIASLHDAEGKYALGLSTGVELHFTGADISPESDYVRVFMTESFGATSEDQHYTNLPIKAGEVDVRVAHIAWCCERQS